MPIPSALQGALPETITAWGALEAAALAQGIVFTLNDFGGIRSEADTTLILSYRQADYAAALAADTIPVDTTINQFRPIAPYGSSYHDYGAAFDVTATGPMADPQSALGALAPSCGLVWGGTFGNPDLPHFQLNFSLAAVKAMWANWQASGEQSDTLTTLQQIGVVAQDPYLWVLAATVAYTGYVIWKTMYPTRKSYETA